MKLIALTPLYKIQPGESFEATDFAGRIALALGVAREDTDTPDTSDTPHPPDTPDPPARPPRTYRRRDLHAEE